MGDEGVGIHAINLLKKNELPRHVELLDGGTGGFHLLSIFEEFDPIVLIDATMDGTPRGTVKLTEPRFASDFPKTLTAHDIGLRDLIESATLIGAVPRLYLVTIAIDEIRSMVPELSPEIAASLPKVVETVEKLLKSDKQSA